MAGEHDDGVCDASSVQLSQPISQPSGPVASQALHGVAEEEEACQVRLAAG